jgi:hypothetical protein
MKMGGAVPAVAIFAGGVLGAVTGGLLAKYWWDFPPEDVETYGFLIVPVYAVVGAVVGLLGSALLVGAIATVVWGRRRWSARA